jgi:hypothetical protein
LCHELEVHVTEISCTSCSGSLTSFVEHFKSCAHEHDGECPIPALNDTVVYGADLTFANVDPLEELPHEPIRQIRLRPAGDFVPNEEETPAFVPEEVCLVKIENTHPGSDVDDADDVLHVEVDDADDVLDVEADDSSSSSIDLFEIGSRSKGRATKRATKPRKQVKRLKPGRKPKLLPRTQKRAYRKRKTSGQELQEELVDVSELDDNPEAIEFVKKLAIPPRYLTAKKRIEGVVKSFVGVEQLSKKIQRAEIDFDSSPSSMFMDFDSEDGSFTIPFEKIDFTAGDVVMAEKCSTFLAACLDSIGVPRGRMGGMKKVEPTELAEYICEFCAVPFRKQRNYNQHMLSIHGKSLRFNCIKCNKHYESKFSFLNHLVWGSLGKFIKCRHPNCYVMCADRKERNEHYLQEHGRVQCEHCGVEFIHAESLNIHKLKDHPEAVEPGTYHCAVCKKSDFESKYQYQSHSRTCRFAATFSVRAYANVDAAERMIPNAEDRNQEYR